VVVCNIVVDSVVICAVVTSSVVAACPWNWNI
jgi:hypothetical protein